MKSKAFWVLGSILSLSLFFALREIADNELFGQKLFRDDAGVPMLLLGLGTMWSVALVMLHEMMTSQQRNH